MAYTKESKKAESAKKTWKISKAKNGSPARRTRAGEKECVAHLQVEACKAAARIDSLRAQVDANKETENSLRSRLADAERKLADCLDASAGPLRKLRNKICKLKSKVHGLSEMLEAASSSSEAEEAEEAADLAEEKRPHKRPKIGSYKKSSDRAEPDAQHQYRKRKLREYEDFVNQLFSKPFLSDRLHDDHPASGHLTPKTKNSSKRGHDAYTWVLHRVMAKHPEIWSSLVQEKKTVQQAEEAAVAKVRVHWEKQGLNLFSRCTFTKHGWQSLINLSSHSWDEEIQDFVRLSLPGTTNFCKFPSLQSIINAKEKLAAELGITSTDVSTSFDPMKGLTKRLEHLDNHNLLSPSSDDADTLVLELEADAAKIFEAKNTNATALALKPVYDDSSLESEHPDLVNSRYNLVLITLYRKDDSLKNLIAHAGACRDHLEHLKKHGIVVNGKHYKIKIPIGGDYKLLQAMMGLWQRDT